MRLPSRGWGLPALFVLVVLPLCLVLAPLIPPAESPDENVQVLRADSLLHGDLVGKRTAIPTPDGPHLEALLHGDPGLTRMMTMFRDLPPDARKLTVDLRARMRSVRWGDAPNLYSAQTAGYPPIFYAPASLGLLAARLARAPPLDALFAARIANALAYALGGAIALALARRGRLLMFAMLVLPMSLWLAASVHPDAPMLACFAIAVALASRWSESDRPPGASPWIAAVLLGCVIALKPPFFPLAGVLLLPFRRHGIATRLGAVALALALGLGWTAYGQLEAAIPFRRGAPYEAGPLFPGPPGTMFPTTDAAAQLQVLEADPLRILTLPLRTMREEAGRKAHEAIGVLGQLDLPLPGWLYRLWGAALAAALLGDMLAYRKPEGPRPWETLFIAAIGIACLFATYLALYLTWTPVGAERIEGIQGRYFLPLLALLGLLLPRVRTAHAPALVGGCTVFIALAPLATAAVLPALTVQTYYLP